MRHTLILDVAVVVGLACVLYGVWLLNPRVVPVILGVLMLGVSLLARCRMSDQKLPRKTPRGQRTAVKRLAHA